MSKKLKEFEFGSTRGDSHPWARVGGWVWQLTRGEDFTAKVTTMATQARGYAKKQGLKARLSVKGEDTLIVQFYKPTAVIGIGTGGGEAPTPKRKGRN
jgi:hypothetical protein